MDANGAVHEPYCNQKKIFAWFRNCVSKGKRCKVLSFPKLIQYLVVKIVMRYDRASKNLGTLLQFRLILPHNKGQE